MTDFSKRKYVMFDLDGTVIDSKPGIYGGLRYAMDKLHMQLPDDSVMRQFIGPSIGATFKRIYGFTQEEADHAFAVYREYYGTRGVLECEVYDGIPQLLKKLHAQGKKLGLATKKPSEFTEKIARRVGLDRMFDVIEGSAPDDKGEYKGYVLKKVIEKFGSPDLSEVVMVGDSRYDCIAAEMAGVDCIGELYGYGNKQDLIDHGAKLVVADIPELARTLCGEEK